MTEGAADSDNGGCVYMWAATVDGEVVGELQCFVTKDTISPEYAFVEPRFRGRGIGLNLYESAYSWAKERGISRVMGHEASTSAHRVHCQLARKWGVFYSNSLRDEHIKVEDFDAAYGPYWYEL